MRIQFLFDFGSPNAYLAHTQIADIESRTGASVEYVPVLLGGVFKATGNKSPAETFAHVPAKRAYDQRDMQRHIDRMDVPYTRNPFFPVNTLQIMRGAVARMDSADFMPYVDAVYRAMWVEGKKMDEADVIASVLEAEGLDTERFAAQIQDHGVKARLISLTDDAVARGVFGSPSFFVDDEQFFGKDRLDWFEAAIVSAKAS
ncbi:MAG: 2-hydroxychromene-2-carboxylate isomerase [Gammaproteobacteria bacterium]|jgi:2-hydroxychromene-2-carboxylate isomerase